MHTQRPATLRLLSFAAALALSAGSAQAEKNLGTWTPIFQGIQLATGTETGVTYPGETTGARQLAVQVLRIDLDNPTVSFFSTPGNGDAPLETVSQTTGDFLLQHDLQVAVNAGFFSPCCATTPQNKDVIGLAISNGNLVSPTQAGRNSLAIGADNQVTIGQIAPDADLRAFQNAVTGERMLLDDGRIVVSQTPADAFANQNPRTAAGVTQDGNTLLLITIDGRQPGYSNGATLYETADWLAMLGAYDAVNLDGGGSTTMVMQATDGGALLLNRPSGGVQRLNGNNFGVHAAPIPEPGTMATMALGIVALLSLQRRRGKPDVASV